MKNWNYNSVHEFLKESGISSSDSPEIIKAAKKRYWKAYKLHHKKQSRKDFPEFTVRFKKSIARKLKKLSEEEGLSVQEFIVEQILDSLNEPVLRNSTVTLAAVQTMSLIYSQIQDYLRNSFNGAENEKELYGMLLDRIQYLEELINTEVWS